MNRRFKYGGTYPERKVFYDSEEVAIIRTEVSRCSNSENNDFNVSVSVFQNGQRRVSPFCNLSYLAKDGLPLDRVRSLVEEYYRVLKKERILNDSSLLKDLADLI